MSEQSPGSIHVALRDVSKNFGGVQAVRDVTMSVKRGDIHALVGENGAGKSTLGKIIAGVHAPSAGEMTVDGRPVHYRVPRQALGDGIAMIEQELALLPRSSVLDNVILGTEDGRGGIVERRRSRRRFEQLVEESGFDLDPNAKVGELRIADQQKVEIMRALARDARLIIMDEPTAPLTPVEAERLYEVMRNLKAKGTTVVFVSHFLSEVLALADTVTVMRDGRHVRTVPAAEETESSLVEAMLGRPLDTAYPGLPDCPAEAPARLIVEGLTAKGRFEDVSFSLRGGEVLGVAGLIGSGRSEVARAIFGADPYDDGRILVDGEEASFRSPTGAIAAGVALLPEDRKGEGLLMRRSIAENMTLPHLDEVSTAGLLRTDRERKRVKLLAEQLNVRSAGIGAEVDTLSGGNQQKVLFGKWLLDRPRVLIVDEPTRGVDVGAKRAIYELIVELAEEGTAILVISSDLEEVLGISHRVMVMRRGQMVAEFARDDIDRSRVLASAFGTGGKP
ncbi:MAG: sugar ABC transporter ATP-binding protein [Solirubrobacterales bacterium]